MGSASRASLEEGPVTLGLPHAMGELSAGVTPVRHPAEGWELKATLEPDNDDHRWGLSMISLDDDDRVVGREWGLITEHQPTVSVIVAEGVETVLVVVADVGDGELDPRQDDWDSVDGRLTIEVIEDEGNDDDDLGDDDSADPDPGGGCTCSASPLASPASLSVALLLALFGLRRRQG